MFYCNLKIPINEETYRWILDFIDIHDKLVSNEINDNEVPIKFIFLDYHDRKKLGYQSIDISYKNEEVLFECHNIKDVNFLIDLIQYLQKYKDVPLSIGMEYTIINDNLHPVEVENEAIIINQENIIYRKNNQDWFLEENYGVIKQKNDFITP